MSNNKQPFKAEPLSGSPKQKEVINVLKNLRKLYNATKCEETKKHIKVLIRTTLYFASERREADYISQEAKKLWDEKAKGSDLHKLTVPKQRANKKKNAFLKGIILEHCNPLSTLMEEIITGKSIETILKKELKTAWITTEENSRLNKEYKSKRPNGWEWCYKQRGIKLKH